jgi:hypothetical protein
MRVRAMTRYPDGADFPSTVEVMRGDLTVTGRPARTFAAWVSDNAPAFLPRSVAG